MEQYGFRTKLTNEVVNAINNKLIVGGIFCDHKNHSIVLIKIYIIFPKIPSRYDTVNAIQVTNDIKVFNSKLLKCVRSFSHVRVLEEDQSRQFFTKHG